MAISRRRPTIATIAQADPAGKWRVESRDRADITGLQTQIRRE
jgi:hypothetical protein